METKLDKYNTTEDRANDALNTAKNCQCDIVDIKDQQKWIWRTMIGAILGGIGTFVSSILGK